MNSLPRQAHQALEQAEQQIREAASEAILAGQYDSATELIGTARQLQGMVGPAGQPSARVGMNADAITEALPVPSAQEERTSTASPRARVGYPRFSRDGDELVKTGWSKTAKSSYEHRCPESVLRVLFSNISANAGRKKAFSVEDVIPKEKYVPAYQAYVAIAWLRAESLLTQHGRRGYTAVSPAEWELRANRAWRDLPPYKHSK